MKKFFLIVAATAVIGIMGCNADRSKKIDVTNFKYTTTDESELYFKNVRQSYYDQEEREGILIFRYSDYDELGRVLIKPIIVYHWRTDRAFIMLETDSLINTDSITISSGSKTEAFGISTVKDHLKVANTVYNYLLDGEDPSIMFNGKETDLFVSNKEKSYYSMILYDFFKFTNSY